MKQKATPNVIRLSDWLKKGGAKNCSELLSNGRRCEINDSMTRDEQTTWIPHMLETTTPVKPRKKTLRKKEGNFTRIFHLEVGRNKIKLCQKMFFHHTL